MAFEFFIGAEGIIRRLCKHDFVTHGSLVASLLVVGVNLRLLLFLNRDFLDSLLFGRVFDGGRGFAIDDFLLDDHDLVSLYDKGLLFGISLERCVVNFLFYFWLLFFGVFAVRFTF